MKKIPTLLVFAAAIVAGFVPMQQAEARDYYVQGPGTYIKIGKPRYYRTYRDNGWRRHRGWFHRHHRDWDRDSNRRYSNRSVYYRWY